jgi:hypothetical protein
MNYVNLYVTCEKKYRSSRSIIKKLWKNRVMYENRENKKNWRCQALYTNLCFFAFNTFVLGFVTGQLQLWSAEPQPWQANLPSHAAAAPQPQSTTTPTPRSGCALAAPRPRPTVPPMPHSGDRLCLPHHATAPQPCAMVIAVCGQPQSHSNHLQN